MKSALKQVFNPPLNGLFWPLKEEFLEEQSAILALVKRLRWKHLLLIVHDEHVSASFGKSAKAEEICVTDYLVVDTNR